MSENMRDEIERVKRKSICGCEEKAQVESISDHGWIPNVTPGAPSWHKLVKHTSVGCKVLTALEVEALREVQAQVPPKEGHKDEAEKPVPMILTCPNPKCCERHVDRGEFATKPHHTHACQHCGFVWRPAVIHTVGVQFLPGFKDDL